MRETQESRPRVNYSSSSTRGIRIVSERSTGWNGSSQAGYEGMCAQPIMQCLVAYTSLSLSLSLSLITRISYLLHGFLLVRDW